MQVVALGGGTFDVVAYPGGLPGAGCNPSTPKVPGKGARTTDDGLLMEGVTTKDAFGDAL